MHSGHSPGGREKMRCLLASSRSPTQPGVSCCQGFQTCSSLGGQGFDIVSQIHTTAKNKKPLMNTFTFKNTKPKPQKLFPQNIARTILSINTMTPYLLQISRSKCAYEVNLNIWMDQMQNFGNTWHPCWCFYKFEL